MTVNVHIGLPDAVTAQLQGVFARTPGITHLGGGSGDAELNSYADLIASSGDWAPSTIKDAFDAAQASGSGPAVLSVPNATTWRSMHPSEHGRRLRQVLGQPRLIAIVRRPVDWAFDHYFSRLGHMLPDTFAGPNPWIEKHLSQLKVKSELAQVKFTESVLAIAERSTAEQILVLPAEQFTIDRPGFLKALDDFIGAEGRLAAAGADPAEDPVSSRTMDYYNAVRGLGLFKRQPERFMAMIEMIGGRVGPMLKRDYNKLIADPETSYGEWIQWMMIARFPLRKFIADDPEFNARLPKFDDYALRPGLVAHLGEIEVEETELIREAFGVDLKPYGYAPEPEPVDPKARR